MADYILEERTAHDLIRQLQIRDQVTMDILAYFTPYCDCDVREYIIAGIESSDYFVLQGLRAVMGPPQIFVPHLPRNHQQVQGLLISTACVGSNLVGTYGTPTEETYTRVLVANHADCP